MKGGELVAQANISIRVDKETKALAEQVCKELGLSMSAAICIFLKKMGRERRIPFEVSASPVPVPGTGDATGQSRTP